MKAQVGDFMPVGKIASVNNRKVPTLQEASKTCAASSFVPETMNCLLNPSHRPSAELRIAESIAYPFDLRLRESKSRNRYQV